MSGLLLDTHAWAWDLTADVRLSRALIDRIDSADNVCVSTVCVYEIAQKVRRGNWPEMAPYATRLHLLAAAQGYQFTQVSADEARLAGLLDWNHRDPFDRIIAATAIINELPLMSADTVFDQLSDRTDWPGRVW